MKTRRVMVAVVALGMGFIPACGDDDGAAPPADAITDAIDDGATQDAVADAGDVAADVADVTDAADAPDTAADAADVMDVPDTTAPDVDAADTAQTFSCTPRPGQGRALVNGPVGDGDFSVWAVTSLGGAPLLTGTTLTAGPDEAGTFDIAVEALEGGGLYVVKVEGGHDLDANGDGVIDATPAPVAGAVHALLTRDQIAAGCFQASLLTEIVYQRVAYLLGAEYSNAALLAELDRRAAVLLGEDLTGDEQIDADDVAAWHPWLHEDALRRAPAELRDIGEAVRAGGPLMGEALRLTDLTLGSAKLFESSPTGVVIGDGLVYVVGESRGLTIVDMADPTMPTERIRFEIPGQGMGLAVTGTTAVVAAGTAGVHVIDVSDPDAPEIQGTTATVGTARGVAVFGGFAYVADDTVGVQVIDLADLSAPEPRGAVGGDSVRDIAVADGLIYAAAGGAGLLVIDASDPDAPVEVDSFELPDFASDVAVRDGIAYVATEEAGLQIVDLDTGSIIGLPTPDDAVRVELGERRAYVLDGALEVIDVSTPTEPALIGSLTTSASTGSAGAFAIAGSTAVVVDEISGGLSVMETIAPTNPAIIGRLDTRRAQGIAATASTVYLSDSIDGLQVVDVTDPTRPTIDASFEVPGLGRGVALAGDFALVGFTELVGSGGVAIFQVAGADEPRARGTAETPGSPRKLHVVGDLAYVAADDGGLQIVDISDPDAPLVVGGRVLPDGTDARGVHVVGDTAYVAAWTDGLQFFDVSDPAAIAPLGASEVPSLCEDVRVVGSIAYVATAELQVVDVSDVDTASVIATLQVPGFVEQTHMEAGLLYLASGEGGVGIVDLTVPTAPRLLAFVETESGANAVAIAGGFVFVADDTAGLRVLRAVTQSIP